MTRLIINVNPIILQWAREEAGYSVQEIAEKLSMSSEKYLEWEKSGEGLPFGKMKKIANYYKRQIATFFLPETPKKLKKPKDYRNINISINELPKEVLLSMRRVEKLRTFALGQRSKTYWEKFYSWEDEEFNNYAEKDVFQFLRTTLGIDLKDQLSFKSSSDAYREWRNAIEQKLGILVFQFSMPLDEVQGFCYSDYAPYAIVVNSKHSYSGRIFTLFHELAHILRHQSGLCTPDHVKQNQVIEFKCNSFAGKFLAPKNTILELDNIDDISSYSKRLKISKEVYLRRMYEENLISSDLFFHLLDKIKESYKKFKKKKSGFALPDIKSKAQRGETVYNMVLNGVNNNQISYSYASELLGLKLKYILNEV